jgi:pyrroloquinoline quinone biosynthesis protein A
VLGWWNPESHENHEARISAFAVAGGGLFQHTSLRSERRCSAHHHHRLRSLTMWTKPEFTEMRFGFEVTMYIYNR